MTPVFPRTRLSGAEPPALPSGDRAAPHPSSPLISSEIAQLSGLMKRVRGSRSRATGHLDASPAAQRLRPDVWKKIRRPLTGETARIDADGSLVPTTGECKQGMDLSHKGIWGYHPLLISLANTGEPLFILNRSGSRPSFEGAPVALDRAVALFAAPRDFSQGDR